MAEHNNLACQQQYFIFLANVVDTDLVRYLPLDIINGLVESLQHIEAVTSIHDFDMESITQNHLPFFRKILNVEGLELIENRLYSRRKNEDKALIKAVVAKANL